MGFGVLQALISIQILLQWMHEPKLVIHASWTSYENSNVRPSHKVSVKIKERMDVSKVLSIAPHTEGVQSMTVVL